MKWSDKMENLGLLIKIDLINSLKLNNLASKKDSNKKFIPLVVLSMILIGFIGFYVYKMSVGILDILIKNNNPIMGPEILLLAGFLLSVLTTLLTSIYRAPSYLFQLRDFDILTSLPISDSVILTSKIVSMLYTNYFFSFFLMIIPSIAYYIKIGDNPLFGLVIVLLFIAAPLLPITISAIISYILGGLSSKIKYKNIVMILGSMFLLVVYMLFMMKIQNSSDYFLKNGASVITLVKRVYPPSYYFIDSLVNMSISSIILFLICSIVPFAAFVFIFSRSFRKINSNMKGRSVSSKYSLDKIKSSSPVKALVIREFRRYFGIYSYIINTSVGLVLLIVASVSLILFGVNKVGEFINIEIILNTIQIQILIFILIVILLSCTTYCSISLEGNNLWILKSNPIEEKDIFKSKIFMNTIITVPISLINFIILAIYFKFNLAFSFISIIGIIFFSILVAIIGLVSNLLFPNLEWKNEVAVVKRSASMLMTWISISIYMGVLFVINLVVNFNNLNFFMLFAIIITIIVDYVLWKWLKFKGVNILRHL
ncbi:MAG: ABC transporter permease [Clostridioides difficile]|nr:ABC transporter permease [Clostridioides difficile]